MPRSPHPISRLRRPGSRRHVAELRRALRQGRRRQRHRLAFVQRTLAQHGLGLPDRGPAFQPPFTPSGRPAADPVPPGARVEARFGRMGSAVVAFPGEA